MAILGIGVFIAVAFAIEAAANVVSPSQQKQVSDVTTVLSEQHVNILASSSHTGADRVARLRFDFELADPSHLESILGAVKRVDSVYDAYRVLPGAGK